MLSCACAITISGEVIALGNLPHVVLSHPNPKPPARTASAVLAGLRGEGDVHDLHLVLSRSSSGVGIAQRTRMQGGRC